MTQSAQWWVNRSKQNQITQKPVAKSQPVARWFNQQQVHRGSPKPWYKLPPDKRLLTHAQKRAERHAPTPTGVVTGVVTTKGWVTV